jgi:hypothetical protein
LLLSLLKGGPNIGVRFKPVFEKNPGIQKAGYENQAIFSQVKLYGKPLPLFLYNPRDFSAIRANTFNDVHAGRNGLNIKPAR